MIGKGMGDMKKGKQVLIPLIIVVLIGLTYLQHTNAAHCHRRLIR